MREYSLRNRVGASKSLAPRLWIVGVTCEKPHSLRRNASHLFFFFFFHSTFLSSLYLHILLPLQVVPNDYHNNRNHGNARGFLGKLFRVVDYRSRYIGQYTSFTQNFWRDRKFISGSISLLVSHASHSHHSTVPTYKITLSKCQTYKFVCNY